MYNITTHFNAIHYGYLCLIRLIVARINIMQKLNAFISTKYINVRENEKTEGCNSEWTIQRHRQHWAHKTQEEDKKKTKAKH